MPLPEVTEPLQNIIETVRAAHASGSPLGNIPTAGLDHIIEYTPADMTVTVEAGLSLAALQRSLAEKGQWLPLDPPNPDRLTIRTLIDANWGGPRRCAFGTIREHLIGIRVLMADGALVRSGGKVVKNVAGYDLARLFIGAGGSLGLVVEATFKLRPLPETEAFVSRRCETLPAAIDLRSKVFAAGLTPTVFDLHNLDAAGGAPGKGCIAILGFAGAREDVEAQLATAGRLGAVTPASLDHEQRFWGSPVDERDPVHTHSVLPSRLCSELEGLGGVPFVVRAANGVIHARGGPPPGQRLSPAVLTLMRRVKETYDPRHVFPPLPK